MLGSGGKTERVRDAVIARVPRRALVTLLQDLSEAGSFEVSRPEGTLALETHETVRLRLDLSARATAR
ncbi:MAG: hypothetical protein HC923_05055 [Myxococcales bacterium]|nr:hypothetical protein [Myxococcales bacterium]